MKIIAHRCGTDKYPGLTLEAALHSLRLGADVIEMDLRYTRDLRPVICHDRDKQALYPGAHGLEEMLRGVRGPILLHVKEGGEKMPLLLRLLREHNREGDVILGVTTCDDINQVKRFNPAIQVLAFLPSLESAQEFVNHGADYIRLWEHWATEDAIRRAQALGKPVWIMARGLRGAGYTSRKNLLLWQRLGVGGVLVNDVGRTISILQETQT